MKESQIHQAFSHFLDSRGVPYVHSNTHRRSSTTVGDPDYCIGWMGKILFVEVKVPGNRLSVAQGRRITFIRAAGCTCKVCYSLEECIEAAQSILCDGEAPEKMLSGENGNPVASGSAGDRCDSKVETAAAQQPFCVGTWDKVDYVFAQNQEGGYSMIRRASVIDSASLPRI